MFSFKSLAVFSTLAFGALSVMGSPVLNNVHDNEAEVTAVPTVIARCDTCRSVPAIIAGVHADVQVHVDALAAITAETCTVEVVGPIVADIKAVIAGAIVEVNGLAGLSADVVLGAGVTVDVVAKVVADLCILIFGAIGVVLNLGVGVAISVVIPLLCGLCECVGALICAVISVCAHVCVGLDVAIFALLKACIGILVQVNATVLIQLAIKAGLSIVL